MSTFERARSIFEAGGPVMWPLLAASVVALALVVERMIFWAVTDRPGRSRWLGALAKAIRTGDRSTASAMLAKDGSVYARFAEEALERGGTDGAAVEAMEIVRPSVERFGATLSTIITAAPMLGILGTVTGIIDSFRVLSAVTGQGAGAADPAAIASGIAEALITTAFGLCIAIATVFPYAWMRTKADRAVGRMETLAAAAASQSRERKLAVFDDSQGRDAASGPRARA